MMKNNKFMAKIWPKNYELKKEETLAREYEKNEHDKTSKIHVLVDI